MATERHSVPEEATARVVLQPIAPPSILGLFGFAAATFIVSAHLAGWYGDASSGGYWFFALAAITAAAAVAASFENLALTSVLGVLAAGAAFAAVHSLKGGSDWETVAGYVLMASAFLAFYLASAMMLESAAGKVVLPLGKLDRGSNVAGTTVTRPAGWALGEPGVRRGQ